MKYATSFSYILLFMSILCLSSCMYDMKNGYNIDTTDHLQSSKSDSNKRYVIAKRRREVFENISTASQLLLLKQQGYEDPDVVCTEPSPDTITVHSSSFSGELGVDVANESGKLSLANALSQTASQLRRSQTIQFLRDAHFNACQAYMNGAISKFQYNKKLDKYADEALVLFAIQQITPQDNSSAMVLASPQLPKSQGTPSKTFTNTSSCSIQCKNQYPKNFSNYSACYNGCVAQNNVLNKKTTSQDKNKLDDVSQNNIQQSSKPDDKVTLTSPLQPTPEAVNAVTNLVGRFLSQQLLNSCIEAAINNNLTPNTSLYDMCTNVFQAFDKLITLNATGQAPNAAQTPPVVGKSEAPKPEAPIAEAPKEAPKETSSPPKKIKKAKKAKKAGVSDSFVKPEIPMPASPVPEEEPTLMPPPLSPPPPSLESAPPSQPAPEITPSKVLPQKQNVPPEQRRKLMNTF